MKPIQRGFFPPHFFQPPCLHLGGIKTTVQFKNEWRHVSLKYLFNNYYCNYLRIAPIQTLTDTTHMLTTGIFFLEI